MSEPTVEDTISILRGLKEKYELHHGMARRHSLSILTFHDVTERLPLLSFCNIRKILWLLIQVVDFLLGLRSS